ncbi:GNAT family N-acetyltransferase [Geojedonia litorea]|uniref:GNAT family N-acetyltransferase n=1 Tax=Geojedonia litorea TaxID=1268269 RepID=A0ABV9N5I1_9FLAO
MKTEIQTDRLVLREITFADKDELFELHTDPDVQKHTGEPVVESLEEIEQSITGRLHDYKTYGFGRLAVIEKGTNAFIGWAGLAYLPEFDKIDIGYRLKKKYWGKGYATEASIAIINYAFNVLQLEQIIAIAMPENKASIKVMEKIGMTYDKHAPYDAVIQNAVWYKLSKIDYLNQ